MAAAAAVCGVAVLIPRVGPNVALIDPVVMGVVACGLWFLTTRRAGAVEILFRRTAPWLALVAAGTLLSLYSAGLPVWALIDMAQTTYALGIFFGMSAVMWTRQSSLGWFGAAFAAGILLTTVSLLAVYEPAVRPAGLFYHPNYAGHFLVTAAIISFYALPWRRVRWVVCGVAAFGVFLTASFGAILMVIVFSIYAAAPWLRARPWVIPAGLAAVLCAVWFGLAPLQQALTGDVAVSDTLSSERLERSGDGRLAVWRESMSVIPDHPFGVGPDGLHNRRLITVAREPHNLYVAYLAERGFIGLVGIVGFGIALWRFVPRGGVTRGLLLALATANLVRETVHYRHMWIALALAVVIDLRANGSDSRRPLPFQRTARSH